jgi:amino acid adenylation domain-containing protein
MLITDSLTFDGPTVVSKFADQVALRPQATALESSEKSLTYSALNASVNALANHLRTRGLGRGDVVAICLKRTANLVVGIMGVLKAGAAYLPLNPEDPSLRLGQILNHAGAQLVISDSNSRRNLHEQSPPTLLLDDPLWSVATGDSTERPADLPQARDIAYVIYTSGTTGAPKGVSVYHGALANIVSDVQDRVVFREAESWLAVTTVSFDIAALELLLPLCFGGKVILASEDQARIGKVLAGMIVRKQPAVVQATPITWRILIQSGWMGSPNLRILCGGDRLDRDLADELLSRCSTLWNMYGPTETTIWSTAQRVEPGEGNITLGKPVAKTSIYILDQDGKAVSDCEVGEICIGGSGLAHGYLNNPELTSRYFINADPGTGERVRLYRTGDLGQWNKNRELEFLGRVDHQVKIDGYRVELPEIERVLQKYPGVAQAAVLGVEQQNNQKRLYAYVVPSPESDISASNLVAHLALHLPKYMIPAKFWVLDRLPTTAHAKRDVVALRKLSEVHPALEC